MLGGEPSSGPKLSEEMHVIFSSIKLVASSLGLEIVVEFCHEFHGFVATAVLIDD